MFALTKLICNKNLGPKDLNDNGNELKQAKENSYITNI